MSVYLHNTYVYLDNTQVPDDNSFWQIAFVVQYLWNVFTNIFKVFHNCIIIINQ